MTGEETILELLKRGVQKIDKRLEAMDIREKVYEEKFRQLDQMHQILMHDITK